VSFPAPGPNCTCLVTGASSGIGVELARELARRGYGLTLVARRGDRLEALAGDLVASAGVRVEFLAVDLTDPEARASIPGELARRGLTVDVLVNNAGFSTVGPAHRADRDRELAMVRTDVEAVVDLCTLFLPGMVANGRGAVLNVASTAAFQPIPGQAGYAAAKAFVLSYSQAVRSELAGTGVTMTALCPGPVRTEFAETAGFADQTNKAPAFVWTDVAEVARQGVDGLVAGRSVVIPGLLNRVSAVGGKIAPRSVLLPILKRAWPAMKASADR
jgi:uncharacterized protein